MKLSAGILILLLALSACRPAPIAAPLRFAVLPILDTLPLYVAETEGYFADEGVAVELVPTSSAAERDQLLQAGQIDGVITDLVALALYNRDITHTNAGGMVVVRYAMVPTPNFAQFRVLAAPGSGIVTPSDLRGVRIGVSEGTVIEYVTNRLLEAEGLLSGEIATLAVPKIPERMALLNAGKLGAATLPEPLASLAMQQGATIIIDDRMHPEYSASLFAFTSETVTARPGDIDAFLRAIDRASTAINTDKMRWDDLLAEQALIPTPLTGTYTLPDYPTSGLPTKNQFVDAVAWLQATGRLETAPAYEDVIR